ncbi:MAG TPA: sigma-70 family RNA polymerase sigma factor [Bryobacteraceae bacterium]|jgi:RNA polymerase sigma-70 factor (ECF subfamily)|nr:sigma-70 family RNA polymerase sigma factor [Bryobacteraceae bacterium]
MCERQGNYTDWQGNYTDRDLVYFAKGGDGQAFGELVRRHHRFCVGLAARILRDRGDAEDETQNAYWSAFQHLNQFQGEAEFSAWLARIVVNHCLMLLRARRRARFLHLDATIPGSSRRRLDLPSWRLDPEGEAGNRQLREVLEQEIRRIPSLLREVVLLRDVQELPIGEVATRLGISVSAAKSRLLRARVELRQRILRHCGRSGRASLTMRVSPQWERLRAC